MTEFGGKILSSKMKPLFCSTLSFQLAADFVLSNLNVGGTGRRHGAFRTSLIFDISHEGFLRDVVDFAFGGGSSIVEFSLPRSAMHDFIVFRNGTLIFIGVGIGFVDTGAVEGSMQIDEKPN